MKKALSVFLSLCFVFTLFAPLASVSVFAEPEEFIYEEFTYSVINGEATITLYDGPGGDVVIPSTLGGYPVTSIGNYAFSGCTSLTSITIPDGVTSIGEAAFMGCWRLTSVTIPNSVTNIGWGAFDGCTSLSSITISDSVTRIGDRAFSTCRSLTSVTIGNSVTSIGVGAFENCDSLTSVTIPDSVTSIGNGAFWFCDSLTSVTLGDSVTSIEDMAFCDCYELTSIAIPDSVTNIGVRAFDCCWSLTSVTIGDNVTSIGNQAFHACENLTSVTIPDDVMSIGNKAFYDCGRLSSVTIYGNPEIEQYAFFSTRVGGNGSEPLDITLRGYAGSSVEAYADAYGFAFEALPGSPEVDSDDFTYSVSNGEATITGYTGPGFVVVIPDTLDGYPVTGIGDWVFYNCMDLTSIIIPDSVTSIGNYAFCYCESLVSVTIPESVVSIAERAFYGCLSLSSATIYGNPEIEQNAFFALDDATEEFVPLSLTLYGYAGSSVEAYADEYGFAFEAIEPVAEILYGDVDGNSEISIGDVTFLAKYVAGWTLGDAFHAENADCDNDGSIGLGDITCLAKYITGWNVTLGPQA